MENRFKNLMHRFQDGSITSAERTELMEMIRKGDFEKETGSEWIYLLKSEMSADNSKKEEFVTKMEEIRNRIYADKRMTTGKQKPILRTRLLVWSSAAVVLLLIIGRLFIGEQNQSSPAVVDVVEEPSSIYQFSGKQFLHLPDGSTVILNEDSELSYAYDFGTELREVLLSGEAFFDVTHDPDHPFIVKTGAVNTLVLGTAFNVTAWPDQDEVLVTVERGKVSVGDDREVYEELLPNEQLTVDTETREFEKTVLDKEQEIEWKKTFFVLDKVTMQDAMQQIGSRYDYKVEIQNPALRNCVVNGAFLDNESLDHVLSVLCIAMSAEYRIEHGEIRILGGIGCEE